jgi:hypothetical protein
LFEEKVTVVAFWGCSVRALPPLVVVVVVQGLRGGRR